MGIADRTKSAYADRAGLPSYFNVSAIGEHVLLIGRAQCTNPDGMHGKPWKTQWLSGWSASTRSQPPLIVRLHSRIGLGGNKCLESLQVASCN